MDVAAFCAESSVLVVAGKGGVGKSTVTAALARTAAGAGLSVLVVELEGQSGIPAAFGGTGPLGYGNPAGPGRRPAPDRRRDRRHPGPPSHPRRCPVGVPGGSRTGADLRSGSRPRASSTWSPPPSPVSAMCWCSARSSSSSGTGGRPDPGGRPRHRPRRHLPDLRQWPARAARGGSVRSQAPDVVELLSDPARCRVMLVTLPEEMPVSETIESAYTLEDKAGVQLGPVVVNACDPSPSDWTTTQPRWRRRPASPWRPSTWPRWRRPGDSGWPATPSRPSRSSGWDGTCPCPTSSCRPSTPPHRAGRDRRCWPTRWPTR